MENAEIARGGQGTNTQSPDISKGSVVIYMILIGNNTEPEAIAKKTGSNWYRKGIDECKSASDL